MAVKMNIDFVEKREGRTRRVKKTGWKRKDGKPGRKKKNVRTGRTIRKGNRKNKTYSNSTADPKEWDDRTDVMTWKSKRLKDGENKK